jgi:hypothetical protein
VNEQERQAVAAAIEDARATLGHEAESSDPDSPSNGPAYLDPARADAHLRWVANLGGGRGPSEAQLRADLEQLERRRRRAEAARADAPDERRAQARLDRLEAQEDALLQRLHTYDLPADAGPSHFCRRCGRSIGVGREARRQIYNQAGRCAACFTTTNH